MGPPPRRRPTPLWLMILVWLAVAALLFVLFSAFGIPGRTPRPATPTIERGNQLVVSAPQPQHAARAS